MDTKKRLYREIIDMIEVIRDDEEQLKRVHSLLDSEMDLANEAGIIPGKFRELVAGIADSLNAGLACFLNLETYEVEEIPDTFLGMDPEEYEFSTGEKMETPKHESWEKCIAIDPLESWESFRVMEYFTEDLEDHQWQEKLFQALNKKRPFANFKQLIDSSPYRQDWFDYKQRYLEREVYQQLLAVLPDELENEE